MSGQNSALYDHPIGVDGQEGSCADKVVASRRHFPENENICRREHDRCEDRHHDQVVLPVAFVLVFISVGVLFINLNNGLALLLINFTKIPVGHLLHWQHHK